MSEIVLQFDPNEDIDSAILYECTGFKNET